MKKVILSARNLCKTFSQGGTDTQILKSVSADIYEGDFTVIMGASGAGKSTLLYSLSGMDGITDGEVLFDGEKISGLPENKQHFGFVFQQTHLVSNLTLFENTAVAGYVGKKHTVNSVREKALELLRQMNVDNAKDRLPSQVSGGEAQRAAIARAMINSPRLIFDGKILDELNLPPYSDGEEKLRNQQINEWLSALRW